MRIIGGIHRGTQLAKVGAGDAAAHLRPTPDRVRESLFNILQGGRYGDPIRDAIVLDIFAGTGALGLEALSRGARHATFVENGAVAIRLIQDNIAKLKRQSETELLRVDATKVSQSVRQHPASLIFLDPPYGTGLGHMALLAAMQMGLIAKNALVVFEDATAQIAPTGFQTRDQRRYGDTWITLMTAAG